MNEPTKHVVCPHCDSINRVPPARMAERPICGRCHRPLFEGRSFPLAGRSFETQLQRNDVPIVVDFWAGWCGPCKAMAPSFERVAAELEPDVRFFKVDTEAEPELAARYSIRSIPTLILFEKARVVSQRAGAMDSQALRIWLKSHVTSPTQAPERHAP
jgi:thioredoxin 2